jgi:DNA-binding beta-propeller fold protein YncE
MGTISGVSQPGRVLHMLRIALALAVLLACLGAAPVAASASQSGELSQLPSPNCVGETGEFPGATCETRVAGGLHDAYELQVSPDGRNAYSVAVNGDLIEYSRDLANGALSVIGCITSLTAPANPCASEHLTESVAVMETPAAIALSPDGQDAYVITQNHNAIVELARNQETGLLTIIPGAHGGLECITVEVTGECETKEAVGLGTPYGVTVSPNGQNVYVASLGNEAIAEFSRDTETGTLEPISGNECIGSASSGCPKDTAIGMHEVIGVVVSPDGKDLYVAAGAKGPTGDVAAFARNESTGALEQLAGGEGCIGNASGCAAATAMEGSEDLVISPDGDDVYANSYPTDAVVELERDASTGALTQLAAPNSCITTETISGCETVKSIEGPLGVAISPEGSNVYVSSSSANAEAAFSRNPSTGALTQLGEPNECVTSNASGCATGFNNAVGLEGARRVAVSPDGTNVYLAAQGGNAIAVLARTVTPTVTGLSPNDGPTAGHTEVTVEGSGFADGAQVDFGDVPALSVTVNSASSITAISPSGSGEVDVTVTNSTGTSTVNAGDVYVYGRLGGLQLSGYCESLGDNGKDAKGEGPTALIKEAIEGPEYAYDNWACVQDDGALVPIAAAGAAPSMNNACAVQYPSGPSHAAPENPNNAFTWSCYEGEPAPEVGGGGGSAGGGSSGGAGGGGGGGGATAKTAAVVPAPQLAVTGNVAPISGTVLVRVPGTSTFVALSSLRQIPFGSVIEATHGHVSVTTAEPNGTTQTGEFFEGEFVLEQGRNGQVVAELTGGNFSVCPTARERAHKARASAAASHASGKHVVRKLWANAHGSFSTKGNYAAGAVQGTEWLTEDLCEGTLIRVTRDKVAVTNLVNHRHVEVKSGHKYLAKAP